MIEAAAMRRAMAKLVPEASGEFAAREPLRVGRFVLLERLAQGGMGVVHAGYDDTLDRRVAIKLIRGDRARTDAARQRLLREAQAMAKLSHPNVVQVFEAGEHEGQVFLAMELIEGLTLRGWLRERARGWREIVATFLEIGRGLAAAHDAGVLHRDFKPDNVLVSAQGAIKVADFGLAALSNQPGESGAFAAVSSSGSSRALVSLTETGEIMGTPAYMPPEQYRGRTTDPASDQFAMCVALFEALFGERPFAGRSPEEVVRNVEAGTVRVPPGRHDVPAWLRAVIVRGLAPTPAQRWPSMHALVAALAHDPVVVRRRRLRQGALALVVVGATAAAAAAWATRPRPCQDGDTRIATVLDDGALAAVDEALRTTGKSYADDTAARVAAALSHYREQWRDDYREACEATAVHQVQSPAVLDLRMACLERARIDLGAAVTVLQQADQSLLPRALALVEGLPSLRECGEVERLQRRVGDIDDPQARQRLSQARALRVAGRIEQAEAELEALAAEPGGNHEPMMALQRGELATDRGRYDVSETLLQSALDLALVRGDDLVAAQAAAGLVTVLGGRGGRFAEAQWLGRVAESLSERSGDPWLRARVATAMGGLYEQQGRFDQAIDAMGTALALAQQEGDDAIDVATAHENLAIVLSSARREPDALVHQRRAVELREASLGPGHPMLGLAYSHLGSLLADLAQFDEAVDEQQRGLAIQEAALGPEHPNVLNAHMNLGVLYDEMGRHGEAQREYRAAIASLERARRPDDPDIARGYNNLGTSLEDDGKLAEAEAAYRHSLEVSIAAFGTEHLDVARTRGNLAAVLSKLARHEQAQREAEQSLAVTLAHLPPEHDDTRYAQRVIGRVRFAAAQAQWDAGAHGPARTLASAAVTALAAAGEGVADERAAAQAWLAAH
ncbi:MAG: serine/threonine-protein kinase [Nannocystaceae bacterium]|nr:serine/threonine-protein kinase [Nannocystaceae bacterium]